MQILTANLSNLDASHKTVSKIMTKHLLHKDLEIILRVPV